jgi:hypothetical protein
MCVVLLGDCGGRWVTLASGLIGPWGVQLAKDLHDRKKCLVDFSPIRIGIVGYKSLNVLRPAPQRLDEAAAAVGEDLVECGERLIGLREANPGRVRGVVSSAPGGGGPVLRCIAMSCRRNCAIALERPSTRVRSKLTMSVAPSKVSPRRLSALAPTRHQTSSTMTVVVRICNGRPENPIG